MTPKEYQDKAHIFANYKSKLYPFLGISEEAGEVCGKMAKFLRKHNGSIPFPVSQIAWGIEIGLVPANDADDHRKFSGDLTKELGDVLWMIAECASVYGISLEDVMVENIEKLTERKNTGTIASSGDTNEERLLRVNLENARFHLRRMIELADDLIEDGVRPAQADAAAEFLEETK